MGFATALDRAIDASLFIGEATVAVAVFTAVAVLVCLQILRARLALRARYAARIVACRDGARARERDRPIRARWLFLDVWNEVARADPARERTAPSQERLRRLLVRGRLVAFIRANLTTRRLRRRLIAIEASGRLGDRGSVASLQRLADDPHPAVSLSASTALVAIDAGSIGAFITHAAARPDWSPLAIERLLRAHEGLKTLLALSQTIDAAAANQRPRLIRFLAGGIAGPTRRYLLAMLESTDDPEVIAAVLRVLSGFANVADADAIRPFLASDVPHVRMRAAVALGAIGRPADAMLLRCLLTDREWWVRYRAAEALVRIAEQNALELGSIAIGVGDNALTPIVSQAQDDLHAEAALRTAPASIAG